MTNSLEKYTNLGLRDSLSIPYKYPIACKELGVILRSYYSKSPKSLQSLVFDDTLFAFHLLPLMQTQSAVSAASLLIQSAESALPKQKRVLAASEFKQAKISYKRRGKILQDDKGSLNLPQDVLVHLFCFLDVQSLLTAGLVCRSWNAAANDSYLWQFQYTNHFDDSERVSKFKGLADNDTAVGKQHELSTKVCTNVNNNWKDNFRKAYLGNPYKSDRGYCLYCNSIVWLSNLRCPNQGLGRTANKHELDPLSPDQIGKYIVDELELPLLMYSEDHCSDSDEDYDYVPSSGIWETHTVGYMT
ncbi:F-box protein At5g52880 isoform X1 [Silene latifolia]|uniref:F-box protein At5g52880 isoform X1 n=1 Tax=Silene latifolia TaxID=37657 RepID=UPI003D76E18A